MKLSQFKSLIREEVRKVLKEADLSYPQETITAVQAGVKKAAATAKGIREISKALKQLAPEDLEDMFGKYPITISDIVTIISKYGKTPAGQKKITRMLLSNFDTFDIEDMLGIVIDPDDDF